MAIIRRVNALSQMRWECSDSRAVESAASSDFDLLATSFISGSGNPYIINGFDINWSSNPIGGAASSLQVIVASGALLHTTASQSGTFFQVAAGTPPVTLNAAVVPNVSGAFVPSSNNYVGIDYYRFQDPTTDTQRYLWNPSSNSEDQIIAPAAIIMNVEFVITSTVWASNILPIAIVQTDSSNNVVSITDARPLLFRLGTGGVSPNPYFSYSWPEGTSENPVTSSSNLSNPFYGGDKAIQNLKQWMEAVESGFLAAFGGPYWYSFGSLPIPSASIPQLREDAINTILTSNGNISHGVVPDTSPVLTTTGNVTIGSNQITSLASTAGITSGQYINGEAFYPGTTVLSVVGSTVTMSGEATDTVTGTTVSFTNPVATQPGQINWSNTLYLKIVGSNLDYTIQANPTGNTVTLTDGQVAYITLTRDVTITAANLVWSNGSAVVTSVGAIPWTSAILAGDWIRVGSASHAGYYQILSVDSTTQVTLTTNYTGTSTGPAGAISDYAFGTYTLPGVSGNSRDIQIAARGSVPLSPNTFWLLARNDDGGALPRVYVRWLGMDLAYGVSENVSGPQIQNVLTYIGSQSESSTAPEYVSAYNIYEDLSSAVFPQITQITTGSGTTVTAGQYFLINSAGNARKYYVWFKVNGAGTDPAAPFTNLGIEVDILSSDTAAAVATKIVTAINNVLPFRDFSASAVSNVITVTNNSSGVTTNASNHNVGAPFAITTTQSGTGMGNYIVNDGDNLTLGIKKLDIALGLIEAALDSPSYDEVVEIVASGATPPTSLNGPISIGTNITLPNNSREGNIPQQYTVGAGTLMVFLNGQFIDVESNAYSEVGTAGSPSSQIQTQIALVVGDELEFRIGSGGGGGSSAIGPQGPAGPTGPTGPAGTNAFGNPVSVSTKTSNYTVLVTDFVVLGDCTGGAITFTLPTAALGVGRIFSLKKIDSSVNVLTIQANGAELIDGSNTFSLTSQWQDVMIVSSGTAWYLI